VAEIIGRRSRGAGPDKDATEQSEAMAETADA
jgi:hypothetical protein